jgi:hypothetical protein
MTLITFTLLVVVCASMAAPAERFRFTNVTASSKFHSLRSLGGHGVQCADANGDGWDDIYVTNIFDPLGNRPDLFFVNSGDGTFRERGVQAGVADDGFYRSLSEESHAAIFADFDNDGDYDLFNAHTWTGNHKLYRNNGEGRFTDVSGGDGIEVASGDARGVAAGDVNGDGFLDLIVSAWADLPMRLYFGRGNLRFELVTLFRGRGTSLANQGIMLVDYDGDGDLDLASTGHELRDLPIGPIALFVNDGGGGYTDATDDSGVSFALEGCNGWSFGDLDNDRDLDAVLVGKIHSKVYLNLGNGRFALRQELGLGNYTAALGDFDHDSDLDIHIGGSQGIYMNDGQAGFELVRDVGLTDPGVDGRGTAVLDFDGDGDLDIVLASKRGPNTLFRNDLNNDNWLKVRLKGPRGDAGAFGTKVYVYDARHVNDPSHLRGFREARGATGYCSQNSPVLHFGVPAGRPYDVKAVFMDGRFFIAKGVEAPDEVLIDPNAPLR